MPLSCPVLTIYCELFAPDSELTRDATSVFIFIDKGL